MTTMTEELWQGMHDGLRAFIAKRVSDQEHIEDILQDVFLRTHRQVDTVNDPRRIVSWLYQVTRNAIIDYYRRPGRRHEILAGLSADIEAFVADAGKRVGRSGMGQGTGALRAFLRSAISNSSAHSARRKTDRTDSNSLSSRFWTGRPPRWEAGSSVTGWSDRWSIVSPLKPGSMQSPN